MADAATSRQEFGSISVVELGRSLIAAARALKKRPKIAPEVPSMEVSTSSARFRTVPSASLEIFDDFRKARMVSAPLRSVVPQSPSPTMESYSVIIGSAVMRLLQA